MVKKLLVAFALAVLGLVMTNGFAAAGPGDYGSDTVPAVAVDDSVVSPGSEVQFSGEGFTPGETVTVDVLGANGQVLNSFDTKADVNGRFSVGVTLPDVAGVYTLRAEGQSSGNVASLTVTVAAAGGNTGSNNSGNNSDGGSWSGNNSGGGSWSDNTANDGDLAYTGTSLTTPLAIGAGALAAGLLLLFFGTRMTIRRKSHSA